MSLETFKRQVERFVSTETPEVIAIKGDWGVGKTYSWNKFLLNANKENRNVLEKYSYVSLFGINSLESLKFSVFENIIDRELIGKQASVETFKKSTTSLVKALGRKGYYLFRASSIASGFNPAIESLFFLSINKVLICIDDLERKGSGLEIKDVMGLVSLLKEQKNCKIVFLLNESEEGSGDYETYKEKVVDIELEFSPTARECASIAYEKKNFEFTTLVKLTQKLDIRNIRILKKIERLVDLAIPLMKGYEEEVKYQVVHSLALYSWCYYCPKTNKEIPTIDYVTSIGFIFSGIGEKEEDEDEQKWKSILQSYDYRNTDELDLVLAQVVKTGFFPDDDFHREAVKRNEEILASKSEESFHQTWGLYHNSFDDNEDEVVNSLYNSLKKNVHHVSLTNLNGTVTLFKELGHDDKASEIIDYYSESRKEETGLFNLKENNFFGDIRDPEIVEKFGPIYEKSIKTESVMEVIARISETNSWNPEDEVVLANVSEDQYYQLFKSINGRELSRYVDRCLQFGRYVKPSEQQKTISINATKALQKIGLESELNRRRVKKFGIEVDNAKK